MPIMVSALQQKAADYMHSQLGEVTPLLLRIGKMRLDPVPLARTLVGLLETRAPEPIHVGDVLEAIGAESMNDERFNDADMVLTKLGHPGIVEQVFWYADGRGFVDADEVAARLRAKDGAWMQTVVVGWRLVGGCTA